MIQIDGKHVDTISTYADSIGTSAANVANWVKKHVEKGGVLEVAHTIGNMKFYEVAALDSIKSAFARTSKPKKRKISEVDYDHMCALLEMMEVELRNAKAYADSIIEGESFYPETVSY